MTRGDSCFLSIIGRTRTCCRRAAQGTFRVALESRSRYRTGTVAVLLAEGVAGVQDVSVASRAGVERAVVLAWEQRHNVVMPAALRSLYMATDGFKLTWNYSTAGTYSFSLSSLSSQSSHFTMLLLDTPCPHNVMFCSFFYSGRGDYLRLVHNIPRPLFI